MEPRFTWGSCRNLSAKSRRKRSRSRTSIICCTQARCERDFVETVFQVHIRVADTLQESEKMVFSGQEGYLIESSRFGASSTGLVMLVGVNNVRLEFSCQGQGKRSGCSDL